MSFDGGIEELVGRVDAIVYNIITPDSVNLRYKLMQGHDKIMPNLPVKSYFDLDLDSFLVELLNEKFHESLYSQSDVDMIVKAFSESNRHHYYQSRKEKYRYNPNLEVPFFEHVLWGASALVVLDYSAEQVTAALLHDTLERQNDPEQNAFNIDENYIEDEFGGHLLDIVRDLSEEQSEYNLEKMDKKSRFLSKMFWSYKERPEFVPIKIMDRVHNLLSFEVYNESSQRRIFNETVKKYEPLIRYSDPDLSRLLGQVTSLVVSKFKMSMPDVEPKINVEEFEEYDLLLELQETAEQKGNSNGVLFIDQGLADIQEWRDSVTEGLGNDREIRIRNYYQRNKIRLQPGWTRLQKLEKKTIERQYITKYFPNLLEQNPQELVRTDREVHRLLVEAETQERLTGLIEDYFTVKLATKDLLMSTIKFLIPGKINFGWGKRPKRYRSGEEGVYLADMVEIFETGQKKSNERIARFEFNIYDLPERYGTELEKSVLAYADAFMTQNFWDVAPERVFIKKTPTKGNLEVISVVRGDFMMPRILDIDVLNPPTLNIVYRLNLGTGQRNTNDVEYVNLQIDVSPYAAASFQARKKLDEYPRLVM
jgi:hypothetical protein